MMMSTFNTNSINIFRITILFVLLSITIPGIPQEIKVFDQPSPLNNNWATGPEIGERIPDFQSPDQHGKLRSFNDIKGTNGAYILFHRSADW